jgi:hypothetical protein
VVEAVERHGRLVLLCSHRSQSVKQSSYIDLPATGAIDGMLYLGSFRSNERLAVAIADGLPVVVVDEPIAGLPPVPAVVMDDYAGGYQATSYNQLAAKSAAQVLARCDADPLLTVGTHGAGRSAAFASDCAPHRCPPGFMYWAGYDRLWANLVRWLAGQ